MAQSRLSAAALTAFSLERIRTVDPGIHSVLAVDPTAVDQAAASDGRRASGRTGPLEGIPVLVKGNTSVGPSLPTTAGSLALADSRPPEAEVVRRLRDAGAVILGTATLSEWASARSPQSASGWAPWAPRPPTPTTRRARRAVRARAGCRRASRHRRRRPCCPFAPPERRDAALPPALLASRSVSGSARRCCGGWEPGCW
ncbi:amidase family protein [Actinomycetospora sp. NBC_00405]|uniref:amidase family protein n=1 Tax=Actinomycetospora sp. NBC_00405 TaxID=2975952 RepID=UPI002E1BDF80